jgi:hypothetical protein
MELMKRVRQAVFAALFWVLAAAPFGAALFAQESRGDYLTVKIAVVGPGDEVYLWWGHIGLIVEDSLDGINRLYDWGVFSFENNNFFTNFAFGRLLYCCMVSRAEENFARNIRLNRSITVYTLDLPPEKKLELYRFAENNIRPENRDYWYHNFRDNCATRVRDIIDTATDGAFRARYENEEGRFTLRQHVRRHTWFSPFWDWILNFWMGQDIDRPITVWDEMFLPAEIGTRIQEFSFPGASGETRALVSSVEVVNQAQNRPRVLERPKAQWGKLALGLALAAVAWALVFSVDAVNRAKGRRPEKPAARQGTRTPGSALAGAALFAAGVSVNKGGKNPFRVLLGLYQAALGFFFGTAGLLLYFMMLFTNHDYTYHNSNALFVHPLLLAALPLGLIYAFTRNEGKRHVCRLLLTTLWTIVFAGGILSMAIKLLPPFYQQNQPTQMLVLPFAFVLSCIPGQLKRLV